MEVLAHAKINLTLDILRKREDGYHDLQMVMQTISLADRILIRPAVGPVGLMQADSHYVPSDGRNLAQAAAAAFRDATGLGGPVDIRISKKIPVCAGLAGGSADAAAVLQAMNVLTSAKLSQEALAEIGAKVGSDVPFCVRGGTALAEGRGDQLTPLPRLPRCTVVLCKPHFSISTPALFSRVNVRKIVHRPDTKGLLASLEAGDLPGVARQMYNVFEDVLEPRQQNVIRSIKATLIECGALGASMSGSGPTVFGLFDDPSAAQLAESTLRESWRQVYLCTSV